MKQTRTLGYLLGKNYLGKVRNYIQDQITEAHPGADIDFRFNPDLAKVKVGYFPAPKVQLTDLCLILDSSGSMSNHVIGGRTFYEYLKEGAQKAFAVGQGDGVHRRYSVVNYSSNTFFSGWVPKSRVRELKPTIDNFQCASSFLDPAVLKQLREDKRERKYGAIMVTDGELNGDPNQVKAVYGELYLSILKGNPLGLVYIGQGNHVPNVVRVMKDYGADVYRVKPEDVPSAMQSYAKFLLKGEKKPEVYL